jgi:hypothetical protein
VNLNMLIETRGGFDSTGADCIEWMRDAVPLVGAYSAETGAK